MKSIFKRTERGFALIEFNDGYNHACSLQKSSAASQDMIWLGLEDVNAQIAPKDAARLGLDVPDSDGGWMPYPLPKEVHTWSRMHLSREAVAQLIPLLQAFVDTGELPEVEPTPDQHKPAMRSCHYTNLGRSLQPEEADADGFIHYRDGFEQMDEETWTAAETFLRNACAVIELYRNSSSS